MTEEINNIIVRLVVNHWREHRRPMMLANLGSAIGRDVMSEIRSSGATLSRYISEYLSSEVRILLIKPTGGGVVPVSALAEYTEDELSVRARTPMPKTPRVSGGRYVYPELWQAFLKPMGAHRRFASFRPAGPELHIITGDEQINPEWIEITSDDLPAFNEEQISEYSSIMEAIEKWADRHKIPWNKVVIPQKERNVPPLKPIVYDSQREVHRIVQGLEALSAVELSRLTFPGDVVLSLLKRMGENAR